MTATNSAKDKFALLFRTGTDDLSVFKDTLHEYYGYPIANIKESTGCANFTSDYMALANQIDAHVIDGTVPSGTTSKTLMVIIVGDADTTGLNDGTNSVTWEIVRQAIKGEFVPSSGPPTTVAYTGDCEVNVLCITPFADGLKAAWEGDIPLANGTLLLVENEADDSLDPAVKSAFISSWNDLMKLSNPTILDAEKLLTVSAVATEIHGGSIGDYFISQRPGTNTDPFYPGRYKLLIRDGDHPGVGSSWWNSPDIWITNSCYPDNGTNEGNNRYMVDEDNDIHVRVTNEGCHSVQPHYVGITVFPYPFATGDSNPEASREVAAVLKPGEVTAGSFMYKWTYDFPATPDHKCIRSLLHYDIMSFDINDPSLWDANNVYAEAQKNITPAPVSCPEGGGGEPPGGGEMPPPVPPEQPEDPPPDPDGAGEKTVDHIRNFREMELLIENPFKDKRTFKLLVPPLNKKLRESIDLKLFSFNEKRSAKIYPFKLRNRRPSVITFSLMPGQQLNLMAYISVKKGVKGFKKSEIPMEVLVQKKRLKLFFRAPIFRDFKRYGSIAGVTFELVQESVSMGFEVVDRGGKPVSDAIVFVSTINQRQAAKLITDKEGKCYFKDINPGAYKVWAYKGRLIKGPEIINAYPRKEKIGPHRIILDK